MSIRSYQENVKLRVTGPNMPVCFPASLEQVSPHHRYRPTIYRNYKDFVNYLDELSIEELKSLRALELQEDMLEELVKPLGGLVLEDVIMKDIRTELGLKRAINDYKEDYGMVVDIKYGRTNSRAVHSVGIIAIEENSLMLFSTHVPYKLRGIITPAKLAISLAISEDKRVAGHPLSTANFLAIPK